MCERTCDVRTKLSWTEATVCDRETFQGALDFPDGSSWITCEVKCSGVAAQACVSWTDEDSVCVGVHTGNGESYEKQIRCTPDTYAAAMNKAKRIVSNHVNRFGGLTAKALRGSGFVGM